MHHKYRVKMFHLALTLFFMHLRTSCSITIVRLRKNKIVWECLVRAICDHFTPRTVLMKDGSQITNPDSSRLVYDQLGAGGRQADYAQPLNCQSWPIFSMISAGKLREEHHIAVTCIRRLSSWFICKRHRFTLPIQLQGLKTICSTCWTRCDTSIIHSIVSVL